MKGDTIPKPEINDLVLVYITTLLLINIGFKHCHDGPGYTIKG